MSKHFNSLSLPPDALALPNKKNPPGEPGGGLLSGRRRTAWEVRLADAFALGVWGFTKVYRPGALQGAGIGELGGILKRRWGSGRRRVRV